MTNGLWKGSLLVQINSLNWKKRFSREHTKNPNANVRARPVVIFRAVGYHPPKVQLAFHIYYVKYGNTLKCKRISWSSGGGGGGGGDVLKYFSISYMYNAKTDHFSPEIKPYTHGNRK